MKLIIKYSHQTGGRTQLSPRVPKSRCPVLPAPPRLLSAYSLCKFPALRVAEPGRVESTSIKHGDRGEPALKRGAQKL